MLTRKTNAPFGRVIGIQARMENFGVFKSYFRGDLFVKHSGDVGLAIVSVEFRIYK